MHSILTRISLLASVWLTSSVVYAQTYADVLLNSGPCKPIQTLTCPSGVINPESVTDANRENFAVMQSTLGVSLIESRSFIDVAFTNAGTAGSSVVFVIATPDQNTAVQLVNQISVQVFDENDSVIVDQSDLNLQQLSVLSGSTGKSLLRVNTPIGDYTIKRVRIQLEALVGLSQSLSVFGVFYNADCPPILADRVINGNGVTNPESAIDQDTATFASLTIPVGITTSASLNLGFPINSLSGDYIGFELSKGNALLDLGLIENITVNLYGDSGQLVFSESDFTLVDLFAVDQLSGILGPLVGLPGSTSNRFVLGVTIPSNIAAVKSAEIVLAPTIGLLNVLRVHSSFVVSKLNGIRITQNATGIINNQPVVLTAESGFTNYRWSNGATGQSITVDRAGLYSVQADRFQGCVNTGNASVRLLDCGNSVGTFADSLAGSGNCNPQVLLVCPSGVNNPENAVDNDLNTFATMSWSVGASLIESTAFLDMAFATPGDAGSRVNVVLAPLNNILNIDVINSLSFEIIDETDSVVARRDEISFKNLRVLNGASNQFVFTTETPLGNYKIKRIRLTAVGTVNVLQQLAVFGTYYSCACPPEQADSVLNAINVTNPGLAVDEDNSNFALMTIPVGVIQDASLQVKFPRPANSGDFVAFQIETDNSLLVAGVIQNTTLRLYDANGVLVGENSSFQLTDVTLADNVARSIGSLLGNPGTSSSPYLLGLYVPDSVAEVSSAELIINPVIGAAVSLRVYNAILFATPQPIVVTADKPSTCDGQSVTLTAAPGFTNYIWSTGQTGQQITVNSPGLYTVETSDNGGCGRMGSILVNAFTLTPNFSDIQPDCGQNDGSLSVNPAGGSGDYGYVWSTGDTTRTITGLSAGLYSVTITDRQVGCANTFEYLLENGDIGITGYVKDANCGQNDGAIYLSIPSDAVVSWSNGATTQVIRNLAPGQYTATVTFSNGCITSETFEVINFTDFGLSATVANPICSLSNGAINLDVEADGSYTYLWSNGETTQDLTGLAPGFYSVVVTNTATGCQDKLRVSLSGLGSPIAFVNEAIEETCARQQNGRISLTLIPNDGSNQIRWNTGQTTSQIENLGPGLYIAEITNLLGCQSTVFVELVGRDSIDVRLTLTNSVCQSPFNGSVIPRVTGGRSPYTYLYSTGDSIPNVTGLAPGAYQLTVTDTNGCAVNTSFTIGRDPSCFDDDPTAGQDVFNAEIITPNGDGLNEAWQTELVSFFPENELTIVSRDGVEVFKTSDYKNNWRGTFRNTNQPLPDGTYFWRFKGISVKTFEYRGFVVIRTK
ncbi:MAG TPA: gliding motility-associated C-terminal domain-containing protein [Luteibaculaceae bacterium]|nr:gliding motility-associated C-terminal domain-containing protein [Luteibaculaceae bacterium]